MKHLQFLVSLSIWLFAFLPMVALSLVVVPILLQTKWDGSSTWFGNRKYPRPIFHDSIPNPVSKLEQFKFYCLRNPASNYGHDVLSVNGNWAWEYKDYRIGLLTFNFGWKLGEPPHTFKFRPRFK